GTLPSHQLALHDGHAQPALGQSTRAMLARRAPTEHDHVVVAAHATSNSFLSLEGKSRRRSHTPYVTWLSPRRASACRPAGLDRLPRRAWLPSWPPSPAAAR